MSLPELSPRAAPEFVDAASCKAWLDNAPLANAAAAQAELLAQLREFNRFPTTPANRLEVMEALREVVAFVQVEQAKRFANRALPMLEAEAGAFAATVDLWDEMRAGYQRLLEAALDHEGPLRQQGALLCQRLLAYAGLRMFHYHRAYRELGAEDWRALHQGYAHAERLGIAEEPVKDFLNRDVHDTSPRIAYVRAVLMAACNPNELTQRQLTFVAYLLERWAAKVEVARAPGDGGAGAPRLVAGLPGEPRYLDTRKLAKSLQGRVALLRKGESPARLGLGEDCAQPSCEQLLVFLYRQWCLARPARALERRKTAAGAHACNDFTAVHAHVAGRRFRQPGAADYGEAAALPLERWRIEDETAQGLRLVRTEGGTRYAHGQLVGVRPDDGASFMLAQVRWLMVAASGELHAGLKLLPGLPSGLAVRPTGLNAQHEKYAPAFGLGAVPALGAPSTLVLPAGWYKPKRVVELFADAPERARLTEVLERGIDFERVSYEKV